jgi:hypothetical protein
MARIFHGKDTSLRSIALLKEMDAAIECGCIFPLSAIHYMEFSRIANAGRRSRLGQVMWKYSQGLAIASISDIVLMEIEASLANFFPEIKIRKINLIGRGVAHAFGEKIKDKLPSWMNDIVEEAMLTGFENIEPISYAGKEFRVGFLSHLESLQETKHQLEKSKWENWLYAITMTDILEPLNGIMQLHGIDKDRFNGFTADQFKQIIEAMPTRRLDVHLHRQVLKNPSFKPKLTDLEDWAALGTAACYCDVVVCEKHFANMVKRDSFKTKTRIETSLHGIFKNVSKS